MHQLRFVIATYAVVALSSAAPGTATPDAAATTPSWSTTSSSVDRRLIGWLNSYHAGPTRTQLDRVGRPGRVGRQLRRLAADPARRPTLRLAAVDALGWYDDSETLAFLSARADTVDHIAARQASTARLLRQHALASFARTRPRLALDTLARAAASADRQTRLAAVVAIGRFGGVDGQRVLAKLRRSVDDPAVIDQMRRSTSHRRRPYPGTR